MMMEKVQTGGPETEPVPAADAVAPDARKPVYMDHNGSVPLLPEVAEAMRAALEATLGNPSGKHWASRDAQAVIAAARAETAALIGALPGEIVLTSGATEANNLALKGVWFGPRRRGAHIVASAIEHAAILKPLQFLRTQGARITLVRPDSHGQIAPESVAQAMREDTVMVSVMHANNETGVIQPIREIAAVARSHGALMHCDAAQSTGKIDVDVTDMGVDMLSLTAHKFGGPNGIGALFIRDGLRIGAQMHGGGQEAGRRSGTESAILAAGLGAAARAALRKDQRQVRALRDYFANCLDAAFGDKVVLNGHPHRRVPNTLSVSFPGQNGTEILKKLPYLAATTGSACHAGCTDMSHVLIAMGASMQIGVGTIRFSLGDTNTIAEIDRVVSDLVAATR